jgi:hypothetical protein
MEFILIVYLVIQIFISSYMFNEFIVEDEDVIRCLSIALFWPLYILKNIVYAFILIFKTK